MVNLHLKQRALARLRYRPGFFGAYASGTMAIAPGTPWRALQGAADRDDPNDLPPEMAQLYGQVPAEHPWPRPGDNPVDGPIEGDGLVRHGRRKRNRRSRFVVTLLAWAFLVAVVSILYHYRRQ